MRYHSFVFACWLLIVESLPSLHVSLYSIIPSSTHHVLHLYADINDIQHQAAKNASAITGFNVLRIINQPATTTIPYNLNTKDWKS